MKILNILIGIVTGIVSGFGIGGGSILVLYLTAVAGISQYIAGGINLLYFLACAPIALIGHIKHRAVDWKIVLWCTLAGVVTAILAALVSPRLNSDWLRRLFGLLLFYIGIKELRAGRMQNNR